MKTPIAALALSALALQAAHAQGWIRPDAEFGGKLNTVLAGAEIAGKALGTQVAANKSDPARLMSSVLTAMNDQPGTGELLVGWLRDNKAEVKFVDYLTGKGTHAMLTDTKTGKRIPAVYLNEKFSKAPVSYRYIGVLIAGETAELMLRDFPDSAEKTYLKTARAAEVYFELGGTRLDLPSFDGIIDQEAADQLSLWIENDPKSGVKLLKAQGQETLSDLLSSVENRISGLQSEKAEATAALLLAPRSPNSIAWRLRLEMLDQALKGARGQRDDIRAAQKEFKAFRKYESDWLMAHQGQLQ